MLFLLIGAVFIGEMTVFYVTPAIRQYEGGALINNWETLLYSMQEYMIASVIFGIIVGGLGTLGVVGRWNKKENVETEKKLEP